MTRILPILIGLCFAIISGLIAAAGVFALADYEKVAADPLEMTFAEFFDQRPEDVFRYQLTDVQHAAKIFPEPALEDGQWENVYVCLFPQSMKRLGGSYTSIIVKVEGVKGSAELTEMLEDGSLEVYYWPEKQNLPADLYHRMAKGFLGMQFQDCLHCEAGAPTPSPDFGNSCIFMGIAGVSLSFLGVLGFYVFRWMRSMSSKNSFDDELEEMEAPAEEVVKPFTKADRVSKFLPQG